MSAWSGSESARFLRSVSRDAGVYVAIAVVGEGGEGQLEWWGRGDVGGGVGVAGWRGRWTPLGVHGPSLGLWQCGDILKIEVFTSVGRGEGRNEAPEINIPSVVSEHHSSLGCQNPPEQQTDTGEL